MWSSYVPYRYENKQFQVYKYMRKFGLLASMPLTLR